MLNKSSKMYLNPSFQIIQKSIIKILCTYLFLIKTTIAFAKFWEFILC